MRYLALLFLLVSSVFAQAYRIDPTPVFTTIGSTNPPGFAQIVGVPYAQIAVCGYPGNSLPCTNYATTYTDGTGNTACPSSKQVVLASTNTCTATTDAQGNFGFWMTSGTYSYTVTTSQGSFGPYAFSIGGQGSSSVTFQVNGTPTAGQSVINFVNTTGVTGFNLSFTNPSAGQISPAITFTNPLAFNSIAPTATRAGDLVYWNGTNWVNFAGNNSGTVYLSENSSGTPSWASGTTSVTINTTGGLTGGATGSTFNLGCTVATSSAAGCLASADWSTFNASVRTSAVGAANGVAPLNASTLIAASYLPASTVYTTAAATFGAFAYNFGGATHTTPSVVNVFASIPATCGVGELFFASDRMAGQNIYGCTSANTWTLQSATGSGTYYQTFYHNGSALTQEPAFNTVDAASANHAVAVTFTTASSQTVGTYDVVAGPSGAVDCSSNPYCDLTNLVPLKASANIMPGLNQIGGGPIAIIANAGSTGTTQYTLTKLTGAPSTAVIAATSDTNGIIGIASSGTFGTSGNVNVQLLGSVSCVFDGATTAGDYIQISSTSGGACHDAGSSRPSSGQIIGRVLSTNGGAGTYGIVLVQEP